MRILAEEFDKSTEFWKTKVDHIKFNLPAISRQDYKYLQIKSGLYTDQQG